ncbi:phosphatidylserine/phosphatidylglycerophosphate/cardiolipin synthase family protein [Reichenbachiella sp. MALMAid0571]|uniref:phospholipase D-like domain-containing protein n=1 Tax=Reichenbachiella sp. MALMAid0571 TaxID=3143939 RepID=UPI0032E03C1A
MNQNSVLVDAEAFKQRLEETIPGAKEVIYVQAMTFEGDKTGKWLIDLLIQSTASDIRLCIDSYSKFVINDHFIFSPKYFLDKDFRTEVKETRSLLKKAKAHGIKVKVTNPLGFLFLKYPFRNHKKIVVVDDISYLGGINFSEHNFLWHDMMIEIHDDKINEQLRNDINQTFNGINQNKAVNLGESQVYFLDGWRSRSKYDEIFSSLKEAQKSIHIFSPYISDPLLTFIKNNINPNVELNIISPKQNNKSMFKSLLQNEVLEGYFNLWLYQNRMSHLKAILVDNEVLISGSSNFDFVSYYFEQEVVLVSRDKKIVSDFERYVKIPDLKNSTLLSISGIRKNRSTQFKYFIVKNSCRILAFIYNSLKHNSKETNTI